MEEEEEEEEEEKEEEEKEEEKDRSRRSYLYYGPLPTPMHHQRGLSAWGQEGVCDEADGRTVTGGDLPEAGPHAWAPAACLEGSGTWYSGTVSDTCLSSSATNRLRVPCALIGGLNSRQQHATRGLARA